MPIEYEGFDEGELVERQLDEMFLLGQLSPHGLLSAVQLFRQLTQVINTVVYDATSENVDASTDMMAVERARRSVQRVRIEHSAQIQTIASNFIESDLMVMDVLLRSSESLVDGLQAKAEAAFDDAIDDLLNR